MSERIRSMYDEGLPYDPREAGEAVSGFTTLKCTPLGLSMLDDFESKTTKAKRKASAPSATPKRRSPARPSR